MSARLTISLEEGFEYAIKQASVHGYRIPREEDLVANAELLMVDMQRVMYCLQECFPPQFRGDIIRLDQIPVVDKDPRDQPIERTVVFHCIQPQSGHQCFAPLKEFITPGPLSGTTGNEHRYFIKAT